MLQPKKKPKNKKNHNFCEKSVFFDQKCSIGCRYIAKNVTDLHQRFRTKKVQIQNFRGP